MKGWFKGQIGWIITAVAMLIGGAMTFGRMQATSDAMYTAISGKADKDAVSRELDQVQTTLDRIERKIDQHMQK